jgi:hypothetical protein
VRPGHAETSGRRKHRHRSQYFYAVMPHCVVINGSQSAIAAEGLRKDGISHAAQVTSITPVCPPRHRQMAKRKIIE